MRNTNISRRLARLVVCAAFISTAAQVAATSAARAQASPMEANVVCRVAIGAEAANASLAGSNTPLVCKTVDPATPLQMIGRTSTKSVLDRGPSYTGALSPQQLQMAWESYIDKVFYVPPTGGG